MNSLYLVLSVAIISGVLALALILAVVVLLETGKVVPDAFYTLLALLVGSGIVGAASAQRQGGS